MDKPKLSVLELRKVNNGWLVAPLSSPAKGHYVDPSEVWVFITWEACSEFLFGVTKDE